MKIAAARPSSAAIALSVIGLCTATAALAQLDDTRPRAGSRIPIAIANREIDTTQLRLIQAKFGDCVVKKHPNEARTFVLKFRYLRTEDSAAAKVLRPLMDGDCLVEETQSSAMLKLPGDTMGYLLAEALFRSELSGRPVLSNLNAVPPLEQPVFDESEHTPPPGKRLSQSKLEEMARNRSDDIGRIYLSRFGECVVRANPSDTHRLLTSAINSPAETTAIAALSPNFKPCLLDDHTVVFNRTVVRGTLAYNYYRLANAAGAGVAVGATRH